MVQERKVPPRKTRRFALLLYRRYHQVNSGLSKFLIALGILLLAGWVATRIFLGAEISAENSQLLLWACLALLALGVLRLLFTWLVSKTAYVECKEQALKIRTPFLLLTISYKRIKNTRPSELRQLFPPDQQKRNRNLLETYWGETVVIIELTKFPLAPRLLEFLMGPYHFEPGGAGLALLVEDWMGFSQSLDQALTDYRTRRAAAATSAGMYRSRR